MRKIIMFTTDGGDREDCNVMYCEAILVGSSTLKFDEPIFQHPTNPYGSSVMSRGGYEDAKDELRALGYTVTELDNVVVVTEHS